MKLPGLLIPALREAQASSATSPTTVIGTVNCRRSQFEEGRFDFTPVDSQINAVALPGPAAVAISTKDKGRYEKGKWVAGRRPNGDEFGEGLPRLRIGMMKFKLV